MTPAKILVVEDEAIIALDIKERLAEFGYSVVGVAADAAHAFALARERKPDLALLDVVIKGEPDGVQVGEYLTKHHDLPVVYLTAYGDTETLQRASASGAYGYLLKPFRPEELRSTIEMALARHQIAQRSQAAARDMVAFLHVANERERAKLAEQLHERLAQELFAVQLTLSDLRARVAKDEHLARRVATAVDAVGDSMRSAAALAYDLHPVDLNLGVVPVLERYARQLFEATPVRCKVSADPAHLAVVEPWATPMFRIAEEALLNAKRHAHAAEVQVTLSREGNDLVLRIRDDGVGFEDWRRETGLGFAKMKAWARLLGAKLEVEARLGSGTAVTLRVTGDKIGTTAGNTR